MNLRLRECDIVYRSSSSSKSAPKIASSADVYRMFGPSCSMRAQESLWVVLLDARMRVIATHEAARGSVSAVSIEQASVFRAAIVTGAAALILVHNHPSGDPTPSQEDLAFTERAQQAGTLLGINLLDHVIIPQGGYYSLLDAGRMQRESSL